MTTTDLTTKPVLTLPTFTLFSRAGGYVLSAHVLEERVAAKVEDWERAGEIVRVATDLTTPEYPGSGVGITDQCGICRETFDLMAEPDQYPSVVIEGEMPELICDACQDVMDADESDRTLAGKAA